MFDNIRFISYETPLPVTPKAVPFREERNPDFNEVMNEEYPDNIKNADFYISGRLDTFQRPPVKDSIKTTLYHMETFSIFYCDSLFFTRRHDYASYLILYTYEGEGFLEYNGRQYELKAGDGFFIDCRMPHFYKTAGEKWNHSVLHFNGPLLPHFYEQYLQNDFVVFSQPLNGVFHTELERLLTIYSTAHPYRDWMASDCISRIVTDLLIYAYSENKPGLSVPDNFQVLIKYMENNFASPLTLDFLAKLSGVSKYHLSREFKKYTGFSPNDYLIQLRIEHAKALLLSTTLPANKIAHIVGIHDINNFTNLFKKKTGEAPGQFRKRAIIDSY